MTLKGWILTILALGLAFGVAESLSIGYAPTGGGDVVAILGGAVLVIVVLMVIYWKEGLSQDRTRMPRIRASGSLIRHALRKEHLLFSFRAWVLTPAGQLPPPPKPAVHDAEFLSFWEAGDLPGCQERLNELVQAVRDPGSPRFARSLFYHRRLEQAEEAAMGRFKARGSEASIFDETE